MSRESRANLPIPVILDTDIGTDIDDTWALAMLLNSPELSLELVVTCHADVDYRAAVARDVLASMGAGHVPVVSGIAGQPLEQKPQLAACASALSAAPHAGDGVDAMIAAIHAADNPVLVSIGPMTNLAAALARDPSIAGVTRVVGMQGSVYRGYKSAAEPHAEYNVVCDVDAARAVLAADWPVTLTPLDTCGSVYLRDAQYQRLLTSGAPAATTCLRHYRAWADAMGAPELPERRTTTLFDTVAVYLAYSEAGLVMEDVRLSVDDEGFTRPDAAGAAVRIARDWQDQPAFMAHLVERLTVGG